MNTNEKSLGTITDLQACCSGIVEPGAPRGDRVVTMADGGPARSGGAILGIRLAG